MGKLILAYSPKIVPYEIFMRKWKLLPYGPYVVMKTRLGDQFGGHGFRGSTDAYLIWHE